ncbi:MAG: 16S rRNA (cytosine(967)-C(5))-methyltransferase RsmB [Proteobacteria bacterium]|nr:16S rRNA (cytosine(967)-C(5))-methyltransferase RsmB [Pseudomonadota bacterium]MBU1584025.1 16S rRNA (cytosine(967)-C(5))-methyltransferase RsmB [Pseudomonadota bacterium]MBU2455066.1 16S rRNA (cytosine(967)-C(5))-methyltransferase RsmB [Pseudomonadota bacterium]MBU2630891.1 16S rRNA (cytosine(967)-C(5))-methyltransferase RsmB [Pseudomonadota bacterium]
MIKDPRHIALNVLLFWHNSSHTLDKSLESYSDAISLLSKQDRNLCNALIFGVLRQRGAIDWTLRAFSNIVPEKIDIKPLYVLRIALFQLLYMDRIPAFAVVNSSVDIAKKLLDKKTAGFINAVLRNAADNFSTVSLPDKKKDASKFISIRYSLPLWLSKKWVHVFGFEKTALLCQQINTIPKITLRTNTLKIDRQSLAQKLSLIVKTVQLTEFATQGIRFTSPSIPIHEFESFNNGFFQIQDEAAQMVTQFLAPRPGEKILDACAGFGGKTGHIAQLMENKGVVVAVDIESKKLDCLQSDSKRLGIDIIQTKPLDLLKTSIKAFDFYFDRVLLDAPCTGLGVLRRNPDTKWKRSKNDITRLAGKQKKMLTAAANLVKPGGLLVYAVCSCEKEENEDVIQPFLEKRKDFSIDKDFQSDTYSVLMTCDGFLKTYPNANNMDGFFAARLKRKSKP